MAQRIVTTLWFATQAEEAATFYTSVFPDSRVLSVTRSPEGAPGPAGSVMSADFELDGQRFLALNGGPHPFTEAVSLQVSCQGPEEVDHYWERLTEGGRESRCGWLEDRYGVSWQVVPADLGEVLGDPDPERAQRAVQAMLGMTKLDMAALRRAADGVPAG